jgi:hypothetical protein
MQDAECTLKILEKRECENSKNQKLAEMLSSKTNAPLLETKFERS